MKNVLLLAALLVSGSALADQCAVVTKKQAMDAIKLMEKASAIHNFCEPCGDVAPVAMKHFSIDLQTFGGARSGSYAVNVDGKIIDLAYTYADGFNLATRVGCPAHGVSGQIQL